MEGTEPTGNIHSKIYFKDSLYVETGLASLRSIELDLGRQSGTPWRGLQLQFRELLLGSLSSALKAFQLLTRATGLARISSFKSIYYGL